MFKNKKNLLVVALILVVLISGLTLFYINKSVVKMTNEKVLPKEIHTIYTPEVLGEEDVILFSVLIDANEQIVNIKARGYYDTSLNEKLEEFTEGLLLAVKGKKLSELENVDKIGKFSLTTKAFNNSLEDLKSQIQK
jgi:hypothetical protein